MPQRLRVFVSSPGDVPDERLRADLVIDKLAQEYNRFFVLEAYRWEHEPMLASGHFQDAIDPPSAFDIVILILWSRLGTPLPTQTKVREYRGLDGRAPVTGTEWEFEEALKAARERGAPDLLAFRNISPAPIDTLDLEVQARSLMQLKALNDFWTRHFADRGTFLAAYEGYRTLEEFAERLEASLRKLIERRIESMDQRLAPSQPIWPGAPFRGLQAYEFEHAAIFFGRDALVAKAAEQLAGQARAGCAFLLVSGASGSGKSSLVKAALVPRLMKPQRIEGAAFVRRASFRPSDGANDIFAGFVEVLTRSAPSKDLGLAELMPPKQTAADLAAQLRVSADSPGFLFGGALGRVTEAERAAGRLLAFEEAKLILVIDQLEEMFTVASITPEDRKLFVRLLGGLARCGAVWVVATIRADFWHRAAEIPELIALCQGQGRIDVAPPSPAELAEMIRKPAQAAGLSFEQHSERGLGLDAVLAEDAASEPGVLPLLSFTLDALYTEDVRKAGRRLLTHATYEALGGLEGAIATRADETIAKLAPAAQAAFPQVLRALVTVSGGADQVTVARAAPLHGFPAGSDARAVVDALTEARLLVASSEGAEPTVRLAHEALIVRWKRAREQLAADRRDIGTRVLIERQLVRWQGAAGRARRQLLLRDPDLANAVDLDRRWRDELQPPLRAFIARSAAAAKAAARRRWTIAAVVMVCLAGLAAASFAALYVAEIQRNEALIAQSRFLARDAEAAIAAGNATLGMLLAVAGLPRDMRNPDRPFIRDAEYALEDAVANRRERMILHGHTGRVWSAVFSPDGARVLTGSEDGTARLWDANTGATVAVLRGHDGAVNSTVFSPDGTKAATTSDDQTTRLWDASTGAPLAVLRGHGDIVTSAAFSPDGRKLVTASDDRTVRVWDVVTGKEIAVLRGHDGLINSVAFSPEGMRLATASTDKTARLWDVDTGAMVLVLRGHDGWVNSAAFSPDGRRIVTASNDRTARVWNAETGAAIAVLRGHENFVSSAAFSPDGRRVITASNDKTAALWDAGTGLVIAVLRGHESWLNSAAISPDGRHVVTASIDGTARLWDGGTGAAIAVLRDHDGLVNTAAFSPDGSRVVTASADGTARLWDTEADAAIAVLRGHDNWLNASAFSPDGTRIVTASVDTTARVWDVRSGATVAVLRGHRDAIRSAAFSPDGKRILTGADDRTARVWNAETGAPIAVLQVPDGGRIWFAAFSPDGKRAATASEDQTARLWDIETGTVVAVLRGHKSLVSGVAFSPDGRRIVTSSWDKTARVWNIADGTVVAVLEGHDGRVTSAAFSPDGSRVLTTSDDKTARLWDAASGAVLAILRGHGGWLYAAAFSRDGRRVATASADDTARIWDAKTGDEISVLRGHGDAVRSVAFSPDGSLVVSGSADNTARLWKMPPHCQALIKVAHAAAPRNFTAGERGQYFITAQPVGASALAKFNEWLAPVLPRAGDACE